LAATAMNIQHAHMNPPIEVPDMRQDLARALDLPVRYPQLLLRLGFGRPVPYSIRRSVEDVLVETADSLLPGRS
jgi:hypothetical protein